MKRFNPSGSLTTIASRILSCLRQKLGGDLLLENQRHHSWQGDGEAICLSLLRSYG